MWLAPIGAAVQVAHWIMEGTISMVWPRGPLDWFIAVLTWLLSGIGLCLAWFLVLFIGCGITYGLLAMAWRFRMDEMTDTELTPWEKRDEMVFTGGAVFWLVFLCVSVAFPNALVVLIDVVGLILGWE